VCIVSFSIFFSLENAFAQNYPQSHSSTVSSEAGHHYFNDFSNPVTFPNQNNYGNEFFAGAWEDLQYENNAAYDYSSNHQQLPPPLTFDSRRDNFDHASVRSLRSVDSISENDISTMGCLKMPPKSAVLTGSIILILLSQENKV
jgi:hypothetical protein